MFGLPTSCNKSQLHSKDILWHRLDVAVRMTNAKCFICLISSTSCSDFSMSYNAHHKLIRQHHTWKRFLRPGQAFYRVYCWGCLRTKWINHRTLKLLGSSIKPQETDRVFWLASLSSLKSRGQSTGGLQWGHFGYFRAVSCQNLQTWNTTVMILLTKPL